MLMAKKIWTTEMGNVVISGKKLLRSGRTPYGKKSGSMERTEYLSVI